MLRDAIKHLIPSGLLVRRLGRSAGNAVLLTFDDGPRAGVTEQVLARLAQHDALAVFFVVGRHAAEAPALLQLISDHGHAIGNHSYAHPIPPPRGLAAYRREIRRCQEIVQLHTGKAPRLFRAPAGKITMASLVAPRLLGMRSVLWSVDSGDWRCQTQAEAEQIAARLLRVTTGGDILLLHDFSPHILTILDVILPGLKSRGLDMRAAVGLLVSG